MDGKRASLRPLLGLDQTIPADPRSASRLINWTVDPRTKGWDNRVGYEKYFPDPTLLYAPWSTTGRIDSLFIWSRHAGAQEWIVFESGGTLYYLADFVSPYTIQPIKMGRNVPAPNEAPSTFAPFGRFLVVVNGYDAPLRYAGWPVKEVSPSVPVYPLGWESLPATPVAWDVDTTPSSIAAGMNVGIDADGAGEYGLGSSTSSAANAYRWKVSFVSNAGGESPLSNPSNTVQWTTESGGMWANRRYVGFLQIPQGPPGTVARRIYRTHNLGNLEDGSDEVYFFVGQVNNNTETAFYDYRGDNQLGSEAPGAADSVPMPCRTARYAAQFKSCLFLDGGSAQGTRLYWSLPGKPDQFAALDFEDLGTRDGGEITGLYAHYNYLIVFRERAIDVVRGSYDEGFSVWPISQGIGTRAYATAATIPDLGVAFLATDGVYLLTGSVDGGGTLSLKKLSGKVQDEIDRMNLDVMARAVGCYSQKWREYHVYFAADGYDRPSLGLVFHLEKMEWSVREGFPVGALAVTSDGDIVFGHHTGYSGTPRAEAGLFAVTRRQSAGHSVVQQGQEYKTIAGTPLTSTYRSAWQDLGDASEKFEPLYVDLQVLTGGDVSVALTALKDHSYRGVLHPAVKTQRPDHPDQFVYDRAKIDGKTTWEEPLVTTLRVAVHPGTERSKGQAGGACSHFAFELATTSPLVLLGWALEFVAKSWSIPAAKKGA